MTDSNHELTRKHEETMARLEAQEAKAKAQRWTVATALITALTAGGGGGFAYFSDDAEDEDVKTAVAVHVATAEIEFEDIDEDLDELEAEMAKIVEALGKLQGAVEILSRRNTRARQEAASVGAIVNEIKPAPPPADAPAPAPKMRRPGADRVQKVRESLFAE